MKHPVEEKLAGAVHALTPADGFEKIRACTEHTAQHPCLKAANGGRRKHRSVWALAACLLLAIGLFTVPFYTQNYVAATIIEIDVNPSIELKVNDRNKVLEAKPLNEDGDEILAGMNLQGTDLKVAANAIVGAMVQKGYLVSGTNDILVSIQNKDTVKADEIKELLNQNIDSSLQQNHVQAAVISQIFTPDSTVSDFAVKNHISTGKASLLLQLAEKDASLNPEELAGLKMREIAKLVEERNIDITALPGFEADDSAKENLKDYVEDYNESMQNQPPENAMETDSIVKAALKEAGVSPSDAAELMVGFETEHGRDIFEVSFVSGGKEYSYELDAVTGEILDEEIETAEPDEESDDDDDDDEDDDDDDDDDEDDDDEDDDEDDKD